MTRFIPAAFALSFLSLEPAYADKADVLSATIKADVLSATIKETAPGSYTISAKVKHADTGWDHYADGWQVVGPDGTVLATRELAHPHVHEQPFVRSLSGVKIPEGVSQITIRARDSVHGTGGAAVTLAVPEN